MRLWLDYYRILQVHSLAEPEVIESAYKRLAKKYHPDVSSEKNSDVRMKQINEAYEVLKDKDRRKEFDAELARRRNRTQDGKSGQNAESEDEDVSLGKAVLIRYFLYIKIKKFENAYELISSADKDKISPEVFIKWQSAVSRIYNLQDYDCKASKTERNVELNGSVYKRAIEFAVVTAEHNTVMNRLEKDVINKKVVLEKDGWRIFVGYEDVRPYIAKFEELNELLAAKAVINEIAGLFCNKDGLSGLFNEKGFVEQAEKEVWRSGRYGNVFSMMLLEIGCNRAPIHNNGHELNRCFAEWAGQTLKDSFRKLDLVGRWGETRFIVLMPGTNLDGGLKAALKIKKVFETGKLPYRGKDYKATISIGVDEFRGSLEKTIERLNNYLGAAGEGGGNKIVYPSGIYEK